MLVTISLVFIFTAVSASYNRTADQRISIFREQGKLVNEIYQARALSISTYTREQTFESLPCGYGIYVNSGPPAKLFLFKDLPNPDGSCKTYAQPSGIALYNGPEENVKEIELKDVTVETNFSQMLFVPPDPMVYADRGFPLEIKLRNARGGETQITINRFGQVSVSSF